MLPASPGMYHASEHVWLTPLFLQWSLLPFSTLAQLLAVMNAIRAVHAVRAVLPRSLCCINVSLPRDTIDVPTFLREPL